MKSRSRIGMRSLVAICLLAGLGLSVARSQQNGAVTMKHASGPFEVKLTPQEGADAPVGRMTIDKQFHGDLEATSKGQMLMTGSAAGSGGYVAMEKVTGTLHAARPHRNLRPAAQRHHDPGHTTTDHHGRAGFRHRATGRHQRKDGHQNRRRWEAFV